MSDQVYWAILAFLWSFITYLIGWIRGHHAPGFHKREIEQRTGAAKFILECGQCGRPFK